MDGRTVITVYMCGPITGLSYTDAVARREEIAGPLRAAGIRVLTPMRGKHRLAKMQNLPSHGYKVPEASARFIILRDFWDVMERSDILIFDARGYENEVSIGSVMELAWSFVKHMYVIMLVNDRAFLGKYEHWWIQEVVGITLDKPQEVIDLVLRYDGQEI